VTDRQKDTATAYTVKAQCHTVKIVGPYYHVQNLCMLYDIEVIEGPP